MTIFVVLCRFTDNFEEFKRHAIPTKHFNDYTSRNNSTPQQITNIIATKLVFLKEINFQKLIFFLTSSTKACVFQREKDRCIKFYNETEKLISSRIMWAKVPNEQV